MRQIVCDRCTNIISGEDEVFAVRAISPETKVLSMYEFCESCKVEFYKFLRDGGKKNAL